MQIQYKSLDRLTIFCFLWAAQALVHQEFFCGWFISNDLIGWTLSVLILGVLFRPSSLVLFILMLMMSIAHTWHCLPLVSNHIVTESIINVAILNSIAWMLYQRRDADRRGSWDILGFADHDSRERLFETFAPILRPILIFMYLFAFIAKLNYDFLNPEVSAAVKMYGDLRGRVPFLPQAPWAGYAAIGGTVIIEAAFPLLFAFRRFWKVGLVLGLLFHLMLGTIGHRTFSALTFGMYFLFISEDFLTTVDTVRKWIRERFAVLFKYGKPIRAAVILSVCLLLIMNLMREKDIHIPLVGLNRYLLWLAGSCMLLGFYFVSIFSRSARQPAPYLVRRPVFMWIPVLVMVFNGMCQYVGLKTEFSFTMYSNLRTEAGWNNHLFMPSWLKIAGYQEDIVDILDTDHDAFKKHRDRNQLITFFEFKRTASNTRGDFWVEYLHNGRQELLSSQDGVSNNPEIMRKHPLLASKFLRFRPISKGPHMEAMH